MRDLGMQPHKYAEKLRSLYSAQPLMTECLKKISDYYFLTADLWPDSACILH